MAIEVVIWVLNFVLFYTPNLLALVRKVDSN